MAQRNTRGNIWTASQRTVCNQEPRDTSTSRRVTDLFMYKTVYSKVSESMHLYSGAWHILHRSIKSAEGRKPPFTAP